MKIITLLILLLSNNSSADSIYFSSLIKNSPRTSAIIYKGEIIFQHLLNKRYVYTVPSDGKYNLQNGQTISVKNGMILLPELLKYDKMYAMGIESSTFFNQGDEDCNKMKFFVAKKILAMECNNNFHQYQMIPIYPDFIRLIIVNQDDIYSNKSCNFTQHTTEELLAIESKTDEAILQERSLQTKQSSDELTMQEKADLKKATKTNNRLKPWEFGVNDRSVIMGSIKNNAILQDNKIAFYINYFNDIGCIPYKQIRLISCTENDKYKKSLMDNYVVATEYTENDKKDYTLLSLIQDKVFNYNPSIIPNWKNEIQECTLHNASINK